MTIPPPVAAQTASRRSFPRWAIATIAGVLGLFALCCAGTIALVLVTDPPEQGSSEAAAETSADGGGEPSPEPTETPTPEPTDQLEPTPEPEPVEVEVPDVSGMNLADSTNQLRQAGLIGVPMDVHPDHAGRTVVRQRNWYAVAQCPGPEEAAESGDTVVLAVIRVDELDAATRQAARDGTFQAELDC